MTHYANPALEAFAATTQISLAASDCQIHLFPNPKTVFSDCDKVQDFLSKRSLSFETHRRRAGREADHDDQRRRDRRLSTSPS